MHKPVCACAVCICKHFFGEPKFKTNKSRSKTTQELIFCNSLRQEINYYLLFTDEVRFFKR